MNTSKNFKQIEYIKQNIKYYSKIYSPNCKKVMELKNKLKTLIQ